MNTEEAIKRAIDKLSENQYDEYENELNRQAIMSLTKLISEKYQWSSNTQKEDL